MSNNDNFDLSRRKVLGGLGTIGAAGALGGAGTMAFFSDTESFEDNEIVAGELDLKVDWTEHYSDWSDDEASGIEYSMTDSSIGPGFPSAAAPDDKLLYVSDKDRFLRNTAVESFPDSDDDGLQDTDSSGRVQFPDGQGGTTTDICTAPADLGGPSGVLDSEYRTESSVGESLVEIQDVKPGDFGEVTFSLHLCDNPGYIWLTGNLVDADENGNTEPEAEDEDEIGPGEDDPMSRDLFDNEGDESNEENNDSANTNQEPVELLDAINAALWYDTGSDIEYDAATTDDGEEGDNYHQADEIFIPAQGSLRNMLQLLESGGAPLDYSPGSGSSSGSDGSSGSGFDVCTNASEAIHILNSIDDLGFLTPRNVTCEELDESLILGGYVEGGTEYVGTKFEANDSGEIPTGAFVAGNGGTITIESVNASEGKVTLSTDFPVEVVSVKGGNRGEREYVFEDQGGTIDDGTPEQFGCVLDSVTVRTPNNKNGNRAQLSNLEICYNPNIPDGGGGGDSGEEDGRECFPNSTTAYIGFEWWLPVDHANEIQGDSVSFDLGFYTEQCRHNDGSGNPPTDS